jgi:hypothetical protein
MYFLRSYSNARGRHYARYGTSLEKSLEDIMVIYYKLFCLTYINSNNINVFSVDSTHKNIQITPLCWQGQIKQLTYIW